MQAPGDALGGYGEEVQLYLLAMSVNVHKDRATGKILGFDWKRVHQDT